MARTVTVVTPVGTFVRQTENEYAVIKVGLWSDGTTIGSTWHYSLANALKATSYGFARVLGIYSVETGQRVAPGFTPEPGGRRAPKVEQPVVVHEFEKCDACDRRHGPERLRCGNCWRCHEATVKCKTTKREIQESIERHAQNPILWKVQTNTWRPFSEVHVPQCACHGTPS
jgi:hypothetical protein